MKTSQNFKNIFYGKVRLQQPKHFLFILIKVDSLSICETQLGKATQQKIFSNVLLKCEKLNNFNFLDNENRTNCPIGQKQKKLGTSWQNYAS